ncbi:type VI secretion protein [Bryobacterales bacterium F-183]|nr:type VI secretion protein [Bryobacterales bacterium F-183]
MASSDYLLKIDTIDGESSQKGHEKWMELQSWSWGESNSGSSGTGSGAGSGKVSMQDFHFVISYGISSPKLFLACASGQHIPSAELHIRKAGGDQQVFVTWKFTDILISSYQTGGSGGSDVLPTDQVSFNFTKIEMEYKPQKADGTLGAGIKAGYDIKKGQKV